MPGWLIGFTSCNHLPGILNIIYHVGTGRDLSLHDMHVPFHLLQIPRLCMFVIKK